ncbi:MAG: hypothetical protein WAN11_16645 [Syntrophobacteraceae bacterium]
MNLLKNSRLFGLTLVLAAGLFFVLQSNNPLPPNIVTPEDKGAGPLSIVPDDKDTTKIEYRNILFSPDTGDKAFRPAEAPRAASPEFLYTKSKRNTENAGPRAFPPTLQASGAGQA